MICPFLSMKSVLGDQGEGSHVNTATQKAHEEGGGQQPPAAERLPPPGLLRKCPRKFHFKMVNSRIPFKTGLLEGLELCSKGTCMFKSPSGNDSFCGGCVTALPGVITPPVTHFGYHRYHRSQTGHRKC